MAVTATPIFPQTIVTSAVQILPADTTSLKTVYTAGTNGSKIECITLSSTDTSARDIQFVITISGTDYILSTLSLVARSGDTNSAPVISAFSHTQFAGLPQDGNGNRFLYLASGAVLKARTGVTITTAKVVSIIAQGSNF